MSRTKAVRITGLKAFEIVGGPYVLARELYPHVGEGLKDMLRYDLGLVHKGPEPYVVLPTFRVAGGRLGGRCTDARWRSYGIRLRECEVPECYGAGELSLLPRLPGEWVTYRHPRVQPGLADYNTLAELTLPELMAELAERG